MNDNKRSHPTPTCTPTKCPERHHSRSDMPMKPPMKYNQPSPMPKPSRGSY